MFSKWKKSSKPPLNNHKSSPKEKGPPAQTNGHGKGSQPHTSIEEDSSVAQDGLHSFASMDAPGYPSQRLKTDEFQKVLERPVLQHSSSVKPGSSAAPSTPIQKQLTSSGSVDAEVEEALNPDNPELKEAISKAKDTGEFRPLLQFLSGADTELTRLVVAALRALTKRPEGLHRARLAAVDGVEPLVTLLASEDDQTAEHAVTTIMNLSLVDAVKGYVFRAPDGISGIVNLLENGSDVAKENSAATLFLLADSLERQEKIGQANAIPLLLELLREGTLRGKKDASLALFNLSLNPKCRKEIVTEGGVELLLELAQESAMEEKAVALLANLGKLPEGRDDIIEEDGISVLVDILDMGTPRSKEDATSVLLLLAQKDAQTALQIDKEGARGGLIKLGQSGSLRGKKKAQELLDLIRKSQATREEESNL